MYLEDDARHDREKAKEVQCALEYTTLRKVTQATEIFYDPDPTVRPLHPHCPCKTKSCMRWLHGWPSSCFGVELPDEKDNP